MNRQTVEKKRQEMTDLLLQYINDNPKEWSAGWNTVNAFPFNGKTGQKYKGANAILLWVIGCLKGYNDPRWVTFNQAQERGATVKKGEKSATVFYWRLYDKKTKKDFDIRTLKDMSADEVIAYKQENVVPVIKTYSVFNAKQCENFPELAAMPPLTDEERQMEVECIEQIIKNSEAPVFYDGGSRAYYSLNNDTIHLPEIKDFKSMQDYYATALHEIAHSTGHESRLNRNLQVEDRAEYAKEELRAELASVFIQDELGLEVTGQHFENHGAYLASWLQAIKEDANEFFKAARDAEKISDYVVEHYATQQKVVIADDDKENSAQPEVERLTEQTGEPHVVIHWCEHNQLDNGDIFPNLESNQVMTFAEADKVLQECNALVKKDEGFYKVKLDVAFKNKNGEVDVYEGCRYDVGCERAGIVEHIEDFLAVADNLSSSEAQFIKEAITTLAASREVKKNDNAEVNATAKQKTIQLKMTSKECEIFKEFVDAYQNDKNTTCKQIADFGVDRPKSEDFWLGLSFLGKVEQSGMSYSVDFNRNKEMERFDLLDKDKENKPLVPAETQTKYTQKEFSSDMNNSVTIQGSLFDEVKVKTSQNGAKYAEAVLEVERNYGDTPKTDLFPVVFFGNAADQISSFKKGSNVSVLGYLKNSTYEENTTLSLVGGKVEPAEIGSKNTVSLSGFVNNKQLELKEAANGTKYLNLALSVKADYVPEGGTATYNTFFPTAFGKTAEKMIANYHRRDLIKVTGTLNISENGKLSVTAHRSELIRSAQEMSAGKDDDKVNAADENSKN